jgi:hypothetical protein
MVFAHRVDEAVDEEIAPIPGPAQLPLVPSRRGVAPVEVPCESRRHFTFSTPISDGRTHQAQFEQHHRVPQISDVRCHRSSVPS